ncbi:MAG: flagellar biosynthetic protein FliR [Bradymonadales bacterium]|nr:flagellar biosynthetic protein FliR [Bradymonadales bacterium]
MADEAGGEGDKQVEAAIVPYLSHQASQVLLVGLLSLIRLLPVVFLVPFMGGRLVIGPVKAGLALVLALVLAPMAWSSGQAVILPQSSIWLVLLALKEVLVGLVIGFLTALVFYAVQMGGALIDTLRGQAMATALVPSMSERVSPTSALGVQLLIVVYLAMDGHHLLLRGLAESFRVVPVTSWPSIALDLEGLVGTVAHLTGEMFAIALALSLPVIAATLLVDMALGVVNRFAPQIHVFFLGMPAKALLGVAMVLLALVAMLDLMTSSLTRNQDWIWWWLHQVGP